MSIMYEELVRQRQHDSLAEAAAQRSAHRASAARRWRRAEAWVTRRRIRAEQASREVDEAR